MVNINTIKQYDTTQGDTSNALLIIGKGESEYKNKEIVKCESIDDAEYIYGENSNLTIAFKEAYEIGVTDIYLCNCYLFTDYILKAN